MAIFDFDKVERAWERDNTTPPDDEDIDEWEDDEYIDEWEDDEYSSDNF